MTTITQILILFIVGIFLCLAAYFTRKQRTLSLTLAIIGGILIAIPFLLLLYFAWIIFTA